MRPYDANTIDKVCSLKRDNKTVGDYWIITDGYSVSMVNQKTGERPTQEISIPREAFNRMVSWYMREQIVNKAER